ncbi:hypothetical protein F3Y22_tig00002317pilonHSYRG00037 [Hibiscus syriacus]|uniref:Glyoxal oxidase N-terminal domain-containing protein n=1 Tax=Hibiscus syriacus TaxID=106335 RepID=A0A6A3CXL8_HIBSY|nr:hypothetical protein F3Y22_tig00002317pilonHSYRG00037 [Hibiscus syriacus]
MLWRGLCMIVPLLFVSVNCQALDKSAGDANVRNKGIAASAETNYKGKWEMFSKNSGVSAMTRIAKTFVVPKGPVEDHCFAHSVLMDFETTKVLPLELKYDTWCSSGALDVKGRLVSTGGYNNGSDTVRILGKCDGCQWKESPATLGNGRWYATQVTLGDGRFMVFGGRDSRHMNSFHQKANATPKTKSSISNGNLFIFANNRSFLLNPKTNLVVHEFPVLPNGARSYPASGCSCMLPITLQPDEKRTVIPAEVLDCGLIDISQMQKANWKILQMPSARILGDSMVLPTGDLLLVNGAKSLSAGWDDARDPNLVPVLYSVAWSEFKELNPSTIPHMYHSTSEVLPDAKILIAGSNTNAKIHVCTTYVWNDAIRMDAGDSCNAL